MNPQNATKSPILTHFSKSTARVDAIFYRCSPMSRYMEIHENGTPSLGKVRACGWRFRSSILRVLHHTAGIYLYDAYARSEHTDTVLAPTTRPVPISASAFQTPDTVVRSCHRISCPVLRPLPSPASAYSTAHSLPQLHRPRRSNDQGPHGRPQYFSSARPLGTVHGRRYRPDSAQLFAMLTVSVGTAPWHRCNRRAVRTDRTNGGKGSHSSELLIKVLVS